MKKRKQVLSATLAMVLAMGALTGCSSASRINNGGTNDSAANDAKSQETASSRQQMMNGLHFAWKCTTVPSPVSM